MNLSSLQTLTWITVAGAVASALALAAIAPVLPEHRPVAARRSTGLPPLPTEPTAAGLVRPPAASAAGDGRSGHADAADR